MVFGGFLCAVGLNSGWKRGGCPPATDDDHSGHTCRVMGVVVTFGLIVFAVASIGTALGILMVWDMRVQGPFSHATRWRRLNRW